MFINIFPLVTLRFEKTSLLSEYRFHDGFYVSIIQTLALKFVFKFIQIIICAEDPKPLMRNVGPAFKVLRDDKHLYYLEY